MRPTRTALVACAAAAALVLPALPANAGVVVLIAVVPDTVVGADNTYRWAGETCGLAAVPNLLGPPNSYVGVLTAGPWAVVDRHQVVVSYDPVGVDAGASSITITCTLKGASALTHTVFANGPVAAPLVQSGSFTWLPTSPPIELCTTVSWLPASTGSPYVHGCVLAITQETP